MGDVIRDPKTRGIQIRAYTCMVRCLRAITSEVLMLELVLVVVLYTLCEALMLELVLQVVLYTLCEVLNTTHARTSTSSSIVHIV